MVGEKDYWEYKKKENRNIVYRRRKKEKMWFRQLESMSLTERQMSGIRSICFGLVWKN